MLPSTGLFKSFACPYFDGGGRGTATTSNSGTCQRPYCHFKHVRKDDVEVAAAPPPVPEYTPAPKLLTLPHYSTLPSKKKKKLEYQPEKPEFNASSSKKLASSEEPQAPVYIPAPTGSCNETNNSASLNLDDCEEELDELSGIIEDQMMEEADEKKLKDIKTEPADEEMPEKILEVKEELIEIKEETKQVKELDKKSHSSKENRRDSTASSSSSSRHKHKSSSKSKESSGSRERKSSKDEEKKRDRSNVKEKEKEKEKDKEKNKDSTKVKKTLSSTSSSSSKLKSSSSSSSRSSDKDKHRSSSSSSSSKHKSSSSSSTTTSSSSKKHPHTSSSSSTSSSRHKSSTASTSSTKSKENHKTKELIATAVASSSSSSTSMEKFDLDSETAAIFATSEEDIMKECEMIYDQLEQEFATLHKDDSKVDKEEKSKAQKRKKLEEDEEEKAAAAALLKKRVAYENAEKFKSHTAAPLPRKPNQNTMQTIFQRQMVLHRKQVEDAAAAETALREAQEKVREANEALRKAKEKNLTPLIPKSFLTPPTRTNIRSIAPVANMLALERAKKKVAELKAEKKPAFTPCQTTKGSSRVAHKATAALAAIEPEKQPKPPVLEANSTKISFNIRMQYYEMMVKHCMAMYPNVADAWERAQTEELVVFKKCNTPVIYKSSALLGINKLRKEAADSGNKPATTNRMMSHEVVLAGKLANSASWSVQKKIKTEVSSSGGEPFDKLASDKAYDMVYELRLTEEQLISNGFPRAGKRPGTATCTTMRPMRRPNETERYCGRCGKVFNMAMYDEVCVDECNYHPKSTGYRRGCADNQHRCCQQPAGTPGCTYGNYHVSDYVDVDNLTGYVTTIDKDDDYIATKKDIFALDCEMCYTTHGIELTRVTVVDINARTVYDALVKPDNKIIDYNTIYSGITEQMMVNETRTLRDVQAILMSMFHSKTVLVGHSLDSDLKAIKLLHSVVVDTSVLFPHKMGPPKKRALKTLCIENLKRIIQENEAGHDSAEDAEVCIQLVKFYLRNKIS